jgi:hypothetical protein
VIYYVRKELCHLTYLLTHSLTYSMEQGPSLEANRFVSIQEIPRILLNPKVHYRIHNFPPPVSTTVQVRGFVCEYFVTNVRFYSEEPLPNPQSGGPSLVGCPRLLIQYISSYPPYWRPFLHPQPEDAPCRGDRDPLTTWRVVPHEIKTQTNYVRRNKEFSLKNV